MNMRWNALIQTGLALIGGVALSAAAEPPMPAWQIHARLDGNTSPTFAKWVAEWFGQRAINQWFSGRTVLHLAGFSDPSTAGHDWACEISALRDINSLMDGLGAKDGKAVIQQGNMDCAVWTDGGNCLQLVSPAAHARQPFPSWQSLPDTAWLCGSIDLTKFENQRITSRLMRMPRQIAFTAVEEAGVVTIEIRGVLANDKSAQSAKRLIDDIGLLLEYSDHRREIIPSSWSCAEDGATLVMRLSFTEESLCRHLSWIREAVTAPASHEPANH